MRTQTTAGRQADEVRLHPDRRWIGYPEAVLLTGLSRSTISRIVRSGRVDFVRWGRTVKIDRGSLEELMQRGGDLSERNRSLED